MNRNWMRRLITCFALCLSIGIVAHAQSSYPTMTITASPSAVRVNQPVTITVSFSCCIANFGAQMTCNVYNASGHVVDSPGISPYGGSATWTPTAAGSYYTSCQWRGYAQYYGTDIPYSIYGSGGNVNVGT